MPRYRKPSALKLMDGNPGKRPIDEREPKPQGGLPRCPKRLEGEAAKAWKLFAKQLGDCGIATSLDATAVEMLCDKYAQYAEARANEIKGGSVWLGNKGDNGLPTFVYSPYYAIARNHWNDLLRMLNEFGMTPSSRTKIKVDAGKEKKDELEDFLKHA